MSDSKAAPGFPYDHLAVLGIDKLKPYIPTVPSKARCLEVWERVRQVRASNDEDKWREYDAAWDVHRQLVEALIPHPTCCEDAKHLFAWCYTNDEGEVVGTPVWKQNFHQTFPLSRQPDTVFKAIHFCPFCGVKLPELRRKAEPPPKVCETDGYYCFVCEERADCCYCCPEIGAWEVVPPV